MTYSSPRRTFTREEVIILEELYKKIKGIKPYPKDDIQQVVECLNNKYSKYNVDSKRIKKWLDNRQQRTIPLPISKPKRKDKSKYTFRLRHKKLLIKDLYVSVKCEFGDIHWVAIPLNNDTNNYNIDISNELYD